MTNFILVIDDKMNLVIKKIKIISLSALKCNTILINITIKKQLSYNYQTHAFANTQKLITFACIMKHVSAKTAFKGVRRTR